MNNEIEKLIEELNCVIYKYERDNCVCRNSSFSSNEYMVYRELIEITSKLNSLNIRFKIDEDNNIFIIRD